MLELTPQPPEERENMQVVKRFRATPSEVEKMNEKAAKAGLTFSEYCRRAALDKPIAEVLPPAVRREIAAVGNNLNQLTRLANSGKLGPVGLGMLNEVLTRLLQTLK
ncbi:MobC family plasmid mobilization relaxosome protein [Hymenobacter defluvii]|uniref:MobC family plasmid mobilization relaxosome protein n=1 Tax=Hymenobacter defluvii TaxID=2054411 RepID=A0ABS3TH54_9BACT|nr:MobC family plasmid mobilization relaxosome protein [Hymenobacter defluvii]MBO3272987.1 MobC family plasmid mobilization relaxosome protein [Hymenobacter defluvii]